MLEFYDASDLSRILHTHVVAPHEPVMLCAAKLSSLLYVDWSKMPFEVHWLDLSDTQPKPAAEKSVIHTQHRNITDMCYVQNGDKELLNSANSLKQFRKISKGVLPLVSIVSQKWAPLCCIVPNC